jgi:altronate dehydratase large subunit
LPHHCGCDHTDPHLVRDTLVGMGCHPNVASVLVVGLGCELTQAPDLAQAIAASGKPVELLVIQDEGGVPKTVSKGLAIVEQLAADAARMQRVPCPLSALVVATECGGSDATSGLVANPTIGVLTDKLIDSGATVIISETCELVGAEHILARRAVTPKVAQHILDMVAALEAEVQRLGHNISDAQPSPGNVAGGLTTIEEKSLGCICKAGSAAVRGVLDYAQRPTEPGLYIMDTPGQDVYSVTGMVAGGAQMVVFSTGRGTPIGNPIAPVVKITANPHTRRRMGVHIDFSAAGVLSGALTVEQAGAALLAYVVAVANGQAVAAELLGHQEFSIYAGPQLVL